MTPWKLRLCWHQRHDRRGLRFRSLGLAIYFGYSRHRSHLARDRKVTRLVS